MKSHPKFSISIRKYMYCLPAGKIDWTIIGGFSTQLRFSTLSSAVSLLSMLFRGSGRAARLYTTAYPLLSELIRDRRAAAILSAVSLLTMLFRGSGRAARLYTTAYPLLSELIRARRAAAILSVVISPLTMLFDHKAVQLLHP